MLSHFKAHLQSQIEKFLKPLFPPEENIPSIELEIPAEKKHGDFSTNIAMKSAKIMKKSPVQIAEDFLVEIEKGIPGSDLKDMVKTVEVKNPGFINFFLTSNVYYALLERIFSEREKFGRTDIGKGVKIQIEFVSANPTGPLSIAHARQAAVGDALANVLQFLGFDVTREFYVNDEGNQIDLLGESIRARALEIAGEKAEIPEHGYQGDYIKDIAEDLIKEKNLDSPEKIRECGTAALSGYGVKTLLDVIKKDLDDFGVRFDVWSHQSQTAASEKVDKLVDDFRNDDLIYEKDGALWFRSGQFGDDKDRVVKKSDGAYTYLTPDIVYHKDKFDRGFEKVFNIWGPDRHGYIPRIKAAVEALGKDPEALDVLIVQLATIYKDGKPVSMSTRRGQYISLREVIDEVGVDVARYFFLMRHINMHLDFDLDLAKRESPENPVYYIQYAYARINSINRKADETGLKMQRENFTALNEEEEIDLIKKMGGLEDALVYCHQQNDPFPLANYLHELATAFHRFYDKHRVIDQDKDLSAQRLGLVNACRMVLSNGLKLLGISAPEKM